MTTVETFTDELRIKPPFLLKVGRKRFLIEETSRLVNKRRHFVYDDELGGMSSVHITSKPFEGTVTLLVGDAVAASAPYSRKGPRVCHVKRYPDDSVEIHFVKKHSNPIDLSRLKAA